MQPVTWGGACTGLSACRHHGCLAPPRPRHTMPACCAHLQAPRCDELVHQGAQAAHVHGAGAWHCQHRVNQVVVGAGGAGLGGCKRAGAARGGLGELGGAAQNVAPRPTTRATNRPAHVQAAREPLHPTPRSSAHASWSGLHPRWPAVRSWRAGPGAGCVRPVPARRCCRPRPWRSRPAACGLRWCTGRTARR